MVYEVCLHIGEKDSEVYMLSDITLKELDYEKITERCIYGVEVSLSMCKRILKRFTLLQIEKIVERKRLISRIGWNKLPEGKWVYCMGNQIIGQDTYPNITIMEDVQKRFLVRESEMSEEDVFQVCKEFLNLKCSTITTLMLTAVVGCLRSLFVEAGVIPHFVVYLYGTTGTYKTTLAKYFCHLYGDEMSLGGLFLELESTNAAFERTISSTRDTCIVIDDIAPCQKNKNTKDKKERAASLIRKAASGTPARKCIGRQVLETNFDAILVFTAEELLETTSTVNRMVLLDTDKYKIGKKALKLMKNNPEFSVAFQKLVIEWAVANSDEVIQGIKEKFLHYRNKGKMSSEDKSRNRLHESFGILHVAWYLLKKCIKYYQSDEVWELEFLKENVIEAMEEVGENQKKVVRKMELSKESENIIKLFYESMSKKKIVIAKNKKEFWEEDGYSKNSKIGLMHKGNLYVLEEKAFTHLNDEYNLQITRKAFQNEFLKEGLVIQDNSEHITKKLNGQRFLVIDYDGLKELCG